MSDLSIIVESARLYTKVIKSFNLKSLAYLYVQDTRETFDAILEAFDDDKLNYNKLLEVLKNRIKYYKTVKLSDTQKFSRFLIYEKDSDKCVGLIGFDAMYLENELYPTSPESQNYDAKNGSILISYKIHPDYCNRGYCTEMMREMLKWFFYSFTHTQVFANIMKDNGSSQKVAKKLGFRTFFEFKYMGSENPVVDCLAVNKEDFLNLASKA